MKNIPMSELKKGDIFAYVIKLHGREIKKYKPYYSEANKRHGIRIFFSVANSLNSVYITFNSKTKRDEQLTKLDEAFNIN